MTLGQLIRSRRRELGLTQDDLSNDVGISASYLAKIELDYQSPGFKTLLVIADVLEIDIDKITAYSISTLPKVQAFKVLKKYDTDWSKLNNKTKKILLELAPTIEKYV